MRDQKKRILRVLALVVVLLLTAGMFFQKRVIGFFQAGHDHAARSSGQSGERKILYWYDPMHPWYKADKPGIAPDCGMELVPKYADEEPAQSQAAAKPGDRKILYWYDPMHPAYKSDKPGIAPDCGMELVPKYADEDGSSMASGTVTISSDKQQLMGIRTGTVERKPLIRDIRTTAQIVAEDSRIGHVHVKVPGFIDKVYADSVGQLVKKGQPLFTLYSPDLVSAQEEYLIAKRGQKYLEGAPYQEVSHGAQSLLRSARERLKLWDISDDQIAKLDETGEVKKTMTFYSPVSGFITERKVFPQISVTPETDLYTVSDLSSVWATADIYENEVPFVRVGQMVNLTLAYYPGKSYHGRISFIYPTVDPQTRTLKVRLEVPNPKFELKPQMFADAQIKVNYGTKLLVPQDAVLNSGTEQTVFVVREGGKFEPRMVTVGPVIDGNAVILSGLKEGETIVTSGNFLIDSESQMKSATGGMKH